MTVNRNEERVAEGTSGSGPSRPVGNKLTQVANAGRQALGRVSGAGKKPGKGRKRLTAERSKDAASGRKRRFFNYPRAGKGKIHRWIPSWRFVLGVFLLGVLSTVGAFMWAYNTIKVPKPSEFALAQSSTVYYADGTTEMGKFAEINRQSVDASTLPDYVGNAVVASEDRSFYSNKGVDPKGIARALVNNLRGGDTQGASTLTQQYVKNYYVDTTSSYSGKFKQAIMAIKIDREKPKKEILGDYLNTVYYGRGAYGIEAASQAFFGHPAKDMSPSEAALLAGILPSPSAWDPAENPDKAKERWGRVLQFMLDDGYITQAQYNEAKQKMPDLKESQTKQVYAGTNGYLLQMVRAELENKAKISPEQIDTGGFRIVTTINQKDQEAAVNAVNSLPPGASPNLRKALVSIDPKTGGLLALYGGDDYLTSQVNTSTDAIAQAGSTFKPFALVAALENGWSLDSGYPATSPMTIEGHEFQECLPEVGQPHPGHGAVAQHPLPPAQSGALECPGFAGSERGHRQGGEPRRLSGEHRGPEDSRAADARPERARVGLPAHDRHCDGLLHLRLAGHPARHPHRGLPQEPRRHGPLHGRHQGASRVR